MPKEYRQAQLRFARSELLPYNVDIEVMDEEDIIDYLKYNSDFMRMTQAYGECEEYFFVPSFGEEVELSFAVIWTMEVEDHKEVDIDGLSKTIEGYVCRDGKWSPYGKDIDG